MVCKQCGATLQEGVKFCKQCGQKVENPSGADTAGAPLNDGNSQNPAMNPAGTPLNGENSQSPAMNTAGMPQNSQTAVMGAAGVTMAAPKTGGAAFAKLLKNKFVWAAIGVVVVAVIAILIISAQPKKIDLRDYITVEFSGYETIGTARIVYDEDGLEAAIAKALKISEKELKSMDDFSYLFSSGDSYKKFSDLRACRQLINASLDQSGDLSNGDTVTLTFDYDNEAAGKYHVKFTGKEVTYTVEGLEDINIIDAFSDLKVTFSGISPSGQLSLEYSGDTSLVSIYDFSADSRYNLKNGDVVTITISVYEDGLKRRGYKLKELSRTYTVEGLDEYIDSYSDLTQEFLDYAKSEAQDLIKAYVAKRYNAESSLGELEYAGYVFDAAKEDPGYFNAYNDLYVIYRGVVSHSEKDFQNTMVYYPVRFSNILSTADGLSGKKHDDIIGSANLGNTWYSTRGYVNPLNAYTDLATANLDKYFVEAGDGFEVFSGYTPISALADISAESMTLLDNDAFDTINLYVTKRHGENSHADDLTVIGYYMLFAKNPGNDFSQNNRVYVVCQTRLVNDGRAFSPATLYYVVEFDGVINLPNGEFMYMKNKGLLGYTTLPNSWSTTSAYTDGADMFRDLVTSNIANYTYEVSEGLKEFGE